MIRIRASAPSARAISTSCCSGIERPPDFGLGVDRRADPVEQPTRRSPALAPADRDARRPPVPGRGRCSRPRSGPETAPAAGRSPRSPVLARAPGRSARPDAPWTSIVPSSGRWAPVITLISVDFPAPFSPTSAWTSPARRSNETPLKRLDARECLADPRQLQERRQHLSPYAMRIEIENSRIRGSTQMNTDRRRRAARSRAARFSVAARVRRVHTP